MGELCDASRGAQRRIRQRQDCAGAARVGRARWRPVAAQARFRSRHRARSGQRLPKTLRQKGSAQDRPSAAAALCLLSDAARLCREVAAHRRISLNSFSFFRRAREDCSSVLKTAHARGWHRIALIGVSDLAEIAAICALEQGIAIVAVVDAKSESIRFVGTPVVKSTAAVPGGFDALVVTDLQATAELVKAVVDQLDADRVLVPALLGVRLKRATESAA